MRGDVMATFHSHGLVRWYSADAVGKGWGGYGELQDARFVVSDLDALESLRFSKGVQRA
jgi:hypothetical protein